VWASGRQLSGSRPASCGTTVHRGPLNHRRESSRLRPVQTCGGGSSSDQDLIAHAPTRLSAKRTGPRRARGQKARRAGKPSTAHNVRRELFRQRRKWRVAASVVPKEGNAQQSQKWHRGRWRWSRSTAFS